MIVIEGLTKKHGKRIILDNVSVKIDDGAFVAITGPSGAGKSSFLNIVGLLDSDYTGKLTIDNIQINGLSKRKKNKIVRNKLNYLYQNYALIDDETVMYNLCLALTYLPLSKNKKKHKVINTLKKFGLDSLAKQKIYSLSGGEQQRIALIRAFLKPGNIILADEPTGNLDQENSEFIFEFLKKLSKAGNTIIMVTHDLSLAKKCDSIIELGM